MAEALPVYELDATYHETVDGNTVTLSNDDHVIGSFTIYPAKEGGMFDEPTVAFRYGRDGEAFYPASHHHWPDVVRDLARKQEAGEIDADQALLQLVGFNRLLCNRAAHITLNVMPNDCGVDIPVAADALREFPLTPDVANRYFTMNPRADDDVNAALIINDRIDELLQRGRVIDPYAKYYASSRDGDKGWQQGR